MEYVKVTILGASEARRVGARLGRAGDGRLRRRLLRAVKDANADVPGKLRTSAVRTLPKRGGLGPTVASGMNVRSRARVSGETVGVTITASHQYHLSGMNQGRVIHPLFGDKKHWYLQGVRPGWFTRVMEGQEAPTQRAIERVVRSFNV